MGETKALAGQKAPRLTLQQPDQTPPMSQQLFFVSGMPRSGTAWVSALINLCPAAYCLHEGEAQYRDGLIRHLQCRDEFYAGDSAPLALAAKFDHLTARRVAILRPLDEVQAAAKIALHGLVSKDQINYHYRDLMTWIARHDPLRIAFDELFTLAGAAKVWEHLLPREYFPEDKIAILIRNRVTQVIPDKETILREAKLLSAK